MCNYLIHILVLFHYRDVSWDCCQARFLQSHCCLYSEVMVYEDSKYTAQYVVFWLINKVFNRYLVLTLKT